MMMHHCAFTQFVPQIGGGGNPQPQQFTPNLDTSNLESRPRLGGILQSGPDQQKQIRFHIGGAPCSVPWHTNCTSPLQDPPIWTADLEGLISHAMRGLSQQGCTVFAGNSVLNLSPSIAWVKNSKQ